MTISIQLTAILIAIVGLVMYLLPIGAKPNEVGRIGFLVGLWGIVYLIVT